MSQSHIKMKVTASGPHGHHEGGKVYEVGKGIDEARAKSYVAAGAAEYHTPAPKGKKETATAAPAENTSANGPKDGVEALLAGDQDKIKGGIKSLTPEDLGRASEIEAAGNNRPWVLKAIEKEAKARAKTE